MPSAPPASRIAGLDSIRFVCALTVLFFHQASPPVFAFVSRAEPVGRFLLGLYDAAFNGQAAVIVFFLISGFCIHFPYAAGKRFQMAAFLRGRLVRIGFPTGAYLALIRFLPTREEGLYLVLWSIWCELAYYALYPLLRMAFARWGLPRVLGASYVAALGVIWPVIWRPNPELLFDAGKLTWVAGLPFWLLGCLLAERSPEATNDPAVSAKRIWAWRLAAYGASAAALLGLLHGRWPLLITLHLFAPLAYLWLSEEVRWFRVRRPSGALEWLGGMSFSIYLVHLPAQWLWSSQFSPHGLWMWAGELVFALALSGMFYVVIERPSHALARLLARSRG